MMLLKVTLIAALSLSAGAVVGVVIQHDRSRLASPTTTSTLRSSSTSLPPIELAPVAAFVGDMSFSMPPVVIVKTTPKPPPTKPPATTTKFFDFDHARCDEAEAVRGKVTRCDRRRF